MTKEKGRPKRGDLADLAIYPPELPRYETPSKFDETIEAPEDIGDGLRVHHVQHYVGGALVAFSVTLDKLTPTGWMKVVRFDSWDGEVHMHQFRADGREERTVLEPIYAARPFQVIERWYYRAAEMMDNEWRNYLGRWQGDPA